MKRVIKAAIEDVVHLGKFRTTYWLRLSKAPETARPQRLRNFPQQRSSGEVA